MQNIILKNAVTEKILTLLYSLIKSENRVEMVVDEVEDAGLKTALSGLASESSNCAREIAVQLKTHGIPVEPPQYHFEDCFQAEIPLAGFTEKKPGGEIVLLCEELEKGLTQAYRALISEMSLPVPMLKELLQIQLNSLKNNFLKIKMVNSARFLF